MPAIHRNQRLAGTSPHRNDHPAKSPMTALAPAQRSAADSRVHTASGLLWGLARSWACRADTKRRPDAQRANGARSPAPPNQRLARSNRRCRDSPAPQRPVRMRLSVTQRAVLRSTRATAAAILTGWPTNRRPVSAPYPQIRSGTSTLCVRRQPKNGSAPSRRRTSMRQFQKLSGGST